MALYFDVMLDTPAGASTVCTAWHCQYNIIAVGSKLPEGSGGIVNLYTINGTPANKGTLMQKSSLPTVIVWHPSRKLLAVGWENGDVLIWNDQEKELHEVPRGLHTASISALLWISSGARLGSGDKEGVWAAWTTDARGRVQHDPIYRLSLGEEITDCVSKPSGAEETDLDTRNIASLAKAAVSGDERALDLLADYKSSLSSRMKLSTSRKALLSFYVGLSSGAIFCIDDKGGKTECVKLDNSIQKLLYSQKDNFLAAISYDLQVVKCKIHDDERLVEMERVKFSGQEGKAQITWAGNSLLAAATGDRSLRLWDLKSGDNYTLPLQNSCGFTEDEYINCVAYYSSKGVLAAGTDQNRVAIWRMVTGTTHSKVEPEDRWKLQPAVSIKLSCQKVEWCWKQTVLSASGDKGTLLLIEQKPSSALSEILLAVQTDPRTLSIDFIGQKSSEQPAITGMTPAHISQLTTKRGGHTELQTDIYFKGLVAASENIAVWNGKQASVYEVTQHGQSHIGTFTCTSSINSLNDQSFFSIDKPKDSKDQSKIQVRNFQGTVKQLIHFQDNEGSPILLSISGDFLVVGTNAGYVKVYDLSRRDAKAHGNSKCMLELIENFGLLQAITCNSAGNKIAFLCKKDNNVPDSKIYIYDCEVEKLESFDFETGANDLEDFGVDTGPKSDIEQSRADAAAEVAGRYPISIHWDRTENRLLCCEAQITDSARSELSDAGRKSSMSILSSMSSSTISVPEVLMVSLFVTQDQGIMLQNSYERTNEFEELIGLKVPYFYFTKSISSLQTAVENEIETEETKPKEGSAALSRVMRDFVGLDDCDNASQAAMLNFSYYLTIGDMDEAFKAIKLIKGAAVWESMARMCVKSRRLDVAKVCLANMGHARGARALREAEKESERDARVARLALELGMNDEAEKLYKNCERYDLLNLFYQATGQWGKALETAELYDRVHLRTTFYKYAKHLEASGDIPGAIPNFEKSGTHYFEVPRMLFDETEMLEAYIMKSKDRKLRKWWAQYMESTGEMDTALKFYQQAADPLSLVRVYCYCGNPEKAAEVANETGDRAACYHLARQFENNDDIKQAIHFFTRAMAYGNAIRICKEHGFEDQLMNLALLSTPSDMVEAARHYEERPDTLDKAVMLYHKAGHFSKALEIAFESKQFGALELISQELDERTDPLLLERCADFFTEHAQHDKAVAMLVIAKKYAEAINVCCENDVRLNETLVEKLTIPKEAMEQPQRETLLVKLADCCMKQGEYHLACKKYTQAGDKEKAMRALLKSGDTERIIFFTGVSKSRNIYVMAANYLQSLDWRKDPEIMKNIIGFYTKGRALDSLATFYDACAQVEIDEYQNYEKALGALSEAFKCLAKAKMANKQQQEAKVTELKGRIALVKKFLQTRSLFDTDPENGIMQCHNLLLEPDLESSVRYGDVYGLLVEYYASQENYDKAYHYMQEFRNRMPSVTLSYYVNVATIEAIHRAVGAPLGRGAGLANGDGPKLDENDDEEVAEELYDGGFGF
ncbi:intraflagellar transport protein 140 homolog [Clavelina lepadiformis]|uniref:intraflagellar transport protein 140 homolog n=1 Tax=Clavelina lepadiformis TaxID=159417 RepID=UPI0040418A65